MPMQLPEHPDSLSFTREQIERLESASQALLSVKHGRGHTFEAGFRGEVEEVSREIDADGTERVAVRVRSPAILDSIDVTHHLTADTEVRMADESVRGIQGIQAGECLGVVGDSTGEVRNIDTSERLARVEEYNQMFLGEFSNFTEEQRDAAVAAASESIRAGFREDGLTRRMFGFERMEDPVADDVRPPIPQLLDMEDVEREMTI